MMARMLSDDEILRQADLENGCSVLAGNPRLFRRGTGEAAGTAGAEPIAKRTGKRDSYLPARTVGEANSKQDAG
jgi:hypothetical protein